MRLGHSHSRDDRGAAAVEFAIVLPVLLLLVFGIIDFGRALNAQVTLTQAAREGARLEALDQDDVVNRTQAAATGLSPVPGVSISSSCPDNDDAVVTVTYTFEFATPVGAIGAMFGGNSYGDPITLTSEGVMPCEG
ncbi:TadE/TadG family type IV pilus assembly protein [Haloechinothrix salitolerans]|uniref:TadE/TadG family type IV pilus assembly protein n=1 Tax=Haloechinothrix salitolerans TaxID=926830 RepID=A0ABW2C3J3_9PSEU